MKKTAKSVRIPSDAVLLAVPSDETTEAYYEGFVPKLVRFYISLLKKADPKHFFIIAAGGERYRQLRRELKDAGLQEKHSVKWGLPDIWCRDVCPVVTPHGTVQFRYHPTLVEEEDAKDIEDRYTKFLNASRIRSSRATIKQDGDERPFFLDGGNFCHDGQDCAVVTRRAACVNEIKRKELARQLTRLTRIKKIAVIPEEPGDILGHADGVVSWLGPKCIAMNRYDEPHEQPFRNEVRAILTETFGKIEIVELPYAPTCRLWKGCQDATGVYTNILHTASAAYVPAFGLPEDEEAIGIIEAHCDRPVIRVPMGKVAQMGGAIRCLTWQNRRGMTDVPL